MVGQTTQDCHLLLGQPTGTCTAGLSHCRQEREAEGKLDLGGELRAALLLEAAQDGLLMVLARALVVQQAAGSAACGRTPQTGPALKGHLACQPLACCWPATWPSTSSVSLQQVAQRDMHQGVEGAQAKLLLFPGAMFKQLSLQQHDCDAQ